MYGCGCDAFCDLLCKFLAIWLAIQEVASDHGCNAIMVHLVPETPGARLVVSVGRDVGVETQP